MSYTIKIHEIDPFSGGVPSDTFKNNEKYVPRLKVNLIGKCEDSSATCICVIDSGTYICIFPPKCAESMGIVITDTNNIEYFKNTPIYIHSIKISFKVKNKVYSFNCDAGFSDIVAKENIGLLGREGFFNLFESVIFDQNSRLVKLQVGGDEPPNHTKEIDLQ